MYSTMNVAASNNMVAEPATELEVASGPPVPRFRHKQGSDTDT